MKAVGMVGSPRRGGNTEILVETVLAPSKPASTPQKTILATEIFAKGFNARGREVGRVSLPFIGVTDLNKALGTGD